ncbi:hypothetical protein [Rhodoferax bucti]|uniref:hypothetical protein n=1 Tax=Rhodoferax bucti TaxID=2576305 RepID=UPI0011099173|nr:hypothetical protein [Rhodoferax bucti]
MATALVPSNFQPHFKRVAAGEDRHADVYCVIASLVGNAKTLDDIRKQAETLGVPKTGPYYPYIDGDLIAKLLAGYGLVATVWKESKDFKDLPDVAIAMVDYDADWEVGRCVVFHRMRSADGKTAQSYCVDSSAGKPAVTTDLTGLIPSWYIGVTQMQKTSSK